MSTQSYSDGGRNQVLARLRVERRAQSRLHKILLLTLRKTMDGLATVEADMRETEAKIAAIELPALAAIGRQNCAGEVP